MKVGALITQLRENYKLDDEVYPMIWDTEFAYALPGVTKENWPTICEKLDQLGLDSMSGDLEETIEEILEVAGGSHA